MLRHDLERQDSIDYDRKLRVASFLLQDFGARDGACGAFSGGKDSCVLKHLAAAVGVGDIPWVYSVTTIDPPELLRFMKRAHPGIVWRHAPVRFFRLLERNGPPGRKYRWCCRELKESFEPPVGGVLFTGVRAAESPRRAATCKEIMVHKGKRYPIVNPLFGWSTADVWRYIRENDVPYCSLYDEGFARLGCVGCPMAGNRREELARWPFIARQWRAAMAVWWETKGRHTGGRLPRACRTLDEVWTWYWGDEGLVDDAGGGPDEPGCQIMMAL